MKSRHELNEDTEQLMAWAIRLVAIIERIELEVKEINQ
jgi:hypothetical protein